MKWWGFIRIVCYLVYKNLKAVYVSLFAHTKDSLSFKSILTLNPRTLLFLLSNMGSVKQNQSAPVNLFVKLYAILELLNIPLKMPLFYLRLAGCFHHNDLGFLVSVTKPNWCIPVIGKQNLFTISHWIY